MAFTHATFPSTQYIAAFQELWIAMWEQGLDISQPTILADDVKRIVTAAGADEWKRKLVENTQRALEKGAFGAPWFWVRNARGEEEPFFGSDR
jgi:2-hydroxychromene-2-carboxylate isomerase